MENNKRDLQLKLLEMAKYIDKLCKENDIEYYLAYGSCLGAVRHNGFIPWDDDFDIAMTYENYKKFCKVCKDKLDTDTYFLQNMETEPNFYLSFAKLRNIKTVLIEESNKDCDITYGVYIDIFPIVGIPKNKLKKSWLKINRAFVLSANRNVINNKILKGIFNIILKIFKKERIIRFCTKQVTKYSCNDCEEWNSIFDGDGFQIGYTTKDIMGQPKYVKFEDTVFPIPEQYDKYLKNLYGDYMQVPSEEQIKFKEHTAVKIELNLQDEKENKDKEILNK